MVLTLFLSVILISGFLHLPSMSMFSNNIHILCNLMSIHQKCKRRVADEVWCQNGVKMGMMVIIESAYKHKICAYSPYFQVLLLP